jgi:hypothetical protein
MDLLDDMRVQFVVYWPPLGINEVSGQRTYGTPIELRVRWEDVEEIFIDSGGRERRSMSKCYPGDDLEEEGILWPGNLEEGILETLPIGASANPKLAFGSRKIQKFEKIPTIEADDFYRCAWM